MTSARPRVVLDTTIINHLEDGGEDSEPLMRGLELGYDVRLPAMVVDEIFATKAPERRDALLPICKNLSTRSAFGLLMKCFGYTSAPITKIRKPTTGIEYM